MLKPSSRGKAQIALEFLIVYSFVLIVFILIFTVITSQRAATLSQQQYSLLQLQSQNIASYIDQAVQAGSGFSATVPLISGVSRNSYSLNISSSGVVIARATVGRQSIVAYGFSHAKSLVINGTVNSLNTSLNGNGIIVYSIPTYKGSITISNLRGVIYIDQVPPSVASLAQGAVVTPQANVKTAIFNSNQKSYILVSNFSSPIIGDSFSVYLWFYANGCGTLVGKSNATQDFSIVVSSTPICVAGYNTRDILDFNYMKSGVPTSFSTNVTFPSMNWINAVATFDGTNGIFSWYINGNIVKNYTGTDTILQSSSALYVGFGSWLGDSAFNGSVANLQIYNSILSPSQVAILYAKGIGSMPINPSIVGWWPLNGNANDYSGFGNKGVAVNITYGSVIQLNAQIYSFSGSFLANSLAGFFTSNGYMSGNGLYSSVKSNNNGLTSGFVTSNLPQGSGNVTTDIFNGNLFTTGNLIGWWPLDTGYGKNIYDFSQGRNTGLFNNPLWTPYVNQTVFISSKYAFPLSCEGASGPHKVSISIGSTDITPSIVNNNTFTVVAWVNYAGPTWPKSQGLFGSSNSPIGGIGQAGFQLNGYCGNPSGGPSTLLYVGNSYLPATSSICDNFLSASNIWQMVTAQYNGNSGAAAIYLNNTLSMANTLSKNLNLNQTLPYQISNDTTQPSQVSGFNGGLTNLQLYDSYLTPQQISSLYLGGLSSLPLQNSGLLGWWPLINNTVDYSNNGNNGTFQNCMKGFVNVTYVSSAYNNTQRPIGPGYVTFNGYSNIIIPYSGGLTSILATAKNNFTISFWFTSFNSVSSFTFNEALINVETSLGVYDKTFNITLCGNGSCGLTGIHGSIGTGSVWLNNSVDYPFSFIKNTWYSITEVFTPKNWTIYLNGNKVRSGGYFVSGVPTLITNGSSIYLGSGPGLKSFTGQMADFQVYNSVLTPQQIMQLYVQGLPPQYRTNISIG